MPASISEWVTNYLDQRPFIKASLKEDIINYSSLARNISPLIESELGKSVNVDSVMVAIRRYADKNNFTSKEPQMHDFLRATTLTLQDGFSYAMMANYESVEKNLYRIIEQGPWGPSEFRILVGSPSHILAVLRAKKMVELLEKIIPEHIIRSEQGFSIVTLRPPVESFKSAGFIHEIAAELAKLGITHMVLAVPPEIHFIISEKNSANAYTAIRQMTEDDTTKSPPNVL